jgi:predicted nucleotidyltransferase component of viral defense system
VTPLKNIAASVRQRLLNRARNDKRPFNELLQYYAMERFLYRLSRSEHGKRFILKGALMLRVWRAPELRPTMDIDMLGKTSNEARDIAARFREMIAVDVEPDGLVFDAESIQSESITEDADYQGVRVRFRGALDSARIAMQVDIGFGDIVYPEPEVSDLPAMLDFPAPRLLCYSRESAIAEKFESMVKHGRLNSRMKDFYDVWLLSRQFDFDGAKLAEAIRLTFEQRQTAIPARAVAFEQDFIDAKKIQWAAFRRRLQQEHVPESFGEVVSAVADFLVPLTAALAQNIPFNMKWIAPGSWSR